MKTSLRTFAAFSLLAAASLRADDVTDAISAAKDAYSAGNLSEAIQSLEYASQLMRQAKGELVAKLLPPAPSGWEAGEDEEQSSANPLLGGLVSARREYSRQSGGQVTLEIQSDSPMLQSFGMMFSNPMMLTASGAKLENFKGQKLAVSYRASDKAGDVKVIVDNRYLVSVEGRDVSRDELLSFVKAIDFAKLAALK
jgi:hypothetical protein